MLIFFFNIFHYKIIYIVTLFIYLFIYLFIFPLQNYILLRSILKQNKI